MSKQETTVVELTQEEQVTIKKAFDKLDLKEQATIVMTWFRALEGKSIDESSVVTKLVDIKNILERSRFPTYPLLAKQVYLRLIAFYNPQAQACKQWADFEAEALIAYKGLNWEAWVEQAKAERIPTQEFIFGQPAPQAPTQAGPIKKAHFWSRPSKPQEQSEFESQ